MIKHTRTAVLSALAALVFVPACGGGATPPASTSKLADKTFAGQNRCNPKNAERPFIIEWDATDQSTFQAITANDVVFVKYEGCDLKVLDGCRDDSVKGSFGSYKPVEWTSGGVETIDIHDENELYAKLPLGAVSLGGRVQSGEQFHMEYYVSGTRTATRDQAFRDELAKNPRCKGATHFVYAYNLGAFGLAAKSQLKGEVNGSYFGFGAGGEKSRTSSAEKKGGDLASCKSDTAREIEGCKVPVRLTLREITDGANPDAAAAKAPDSDASLNLAGKLAATTDAEKSAAGHLDTAKVKKESRDGKACLAELDAHDRLDPRPLGLSTNPASGANAGLRAECLMLAGQCDVGKEQFRKAVQATKGGQIGPEHIDKMTEAEASMFCQGTNLSDRDRYLRALRDLQDAAYGVKKRTAAECQSAFDTAMRLRTTVKRRDANDTMIPEKPLVGLGASGARCFANAGDCDTAYSVYKAVNEARTDADQDGFIAPNEKSLRIGFDGNVPMCKGKGPQPSPDPPAAPKGRGKKPKK